MQVCYLLSLDAPNNYWRLLLISALSCKQTNPDLKTVLVTDTVTRNILDGELRQARALGALDDVRVVAVDEVGAKARSRFLKTSLRSHVEGDVLFLDADTIVAGPLDLPVGEAEIAAVREFNFQDGQPQPQVVERCRLLNWVGPTAPYFNSGVLFFRDTPAVWDLFARWHALWRQQVTEISILGDQIALAEALHDADCTHAILPDRFNAQIIHAPQLSKGAVVLHHFEDHPHKDLRLPTVWDDLLRGGEITVDAVASRLAQPFYRTSSLSGPFWTSIMGENPEKNVPLNDWRRLWLVGYRRQSAKALLRRTFGHGGA